MYFSIPNTEWDSNFWTLNFRCFVSWTARKLTNALVINSVTYISYSVFSKSTLQFSRLFPTYPYLWSFSRLFKALKISTLNSRTFHTFPGSVRTLLTMWTRPDVSHRWDVRLKFLEAKILYRMGSDFQKCWNANWDHSAYHVEVWNRSHSFVQSRSGLTIWWESGVRRQESKASTVTTRCHNVLLLAN